MLLKIDILIRKRNWIIRVRFKISSYFANDGIDSSMIKPLKIKFLLKCGQSDFFCKVFFQLFKFLLLEIESTVFKASLKHFLSFLFVSFRPVFNSFLAHTILAVYSFRVARLRLGFFGFELIELSVNWRMLFLAVQCSLSHLH